MFGGVIGMTIDAFNDKAYDPPKNFNLAPLCADASKMNNEIASPSNESAGRSPSSSKNGPI